LPPDQSLKQAIQQNLWKDNPVTLQDIENAEKIWGPDLGILRGRTTRRSPPVIRGEEDAIDIPPELKVHHQNMELCIDLMYINSFGMMTAIDKTVIFRSLVPNTSEKADDFYKALDKILRMYNSAGFRVKYIHCDLQFKPLMDEAKDGLDVIMNYTSQGDHQSEAERNNRVIQERFRAIAHSLPYKVMPGVMIRYLAMACTQALNYFPAKNGISSHYSPYMLMYSKTLDYKKQC
jgi:hypothetical protein